MSKTKKHNQGFSFIELLIALTILSIVMIMVVQFMSTSSLAYRKTKDNMNVQTKAMKVVEQMSDTLMQAKYIRVATKDDGMYTITQEGTAEDKTRVVRSVSSVTVDYDFVPDNYPNYALNSSYLVDPSVAEPKERQVIVDFDTYQLIDVDDNAYPLASDADKKYLASGGGVVPLSDIDVRSYRALKETNVYRYIKPEFIYVEYAGTAGKTIHAMYHITDTTNEDDDTCSIYLYRYETNDNDLAATRERNFYHAKSVILSNLDKDFDTIRDSADASDFVSVSEDDETMNLIDNGVDGLLTDIVADFYLSADTEGNAIITNILFKDGDYEYNTNETINFRNSNVLTVRPQDLYKKSGTGTP